MRGASPSAARSTESTRELNSMLAGRSMNCRVFSTSRLACHRTIAATGKEAAERIASLTQESADRLRAENAASSNAITERTGETLDAISLRAEETAKAMKMVENRLQSTAMA